MAAVYNSGAHVDKKGRMHGIELDCTLIMTFQSQIATRKTLEMKFVGLHRLSLPGCAEDRFGDIFTCDLSFHGDFIIWSENACFNSGNPQGEPDETLVMARRLEWRFAE